MLKVVSEKEPIGIIKLSEKLDMPQHKVRYSLRLLEQEGVVEATNRGAETTRNTKKYLVDLKKDLEAMNMTIEDIRKSLG